MRKLILMLLLVSAPLIADEADILAPHHRVVTYDLSHTFDMRSLIQKGGFSDLVESSIPVPGDLALNETFGTTVAVEGNLVAVAAEASDLSGRVFFFRREGDAYVPEGEVFAVSDILSCSPEISLSISDGLVFISSPRDETSPPPPDSCFAIGEGIINVAAKCPSGEWRIAAQFFPEQVEGQTGFGTAVALSDNMMAVGSPSDSEGAVRIFELPEQIELDCTSSTIEPTQVSEVDILRPTVKSKGNSQSRFGQALAFKQGKLAVGAPGAVGSAVSGNVSLYQMISGSLQQTGIPIQSSMSEPDDQFGNSVALEGNTLAVGAPGQNSNVGQAFTYDFSSRLQTRTIPPPPNAGRFGWDVDFFKRSLFVSTPGFTGLTKGTATQGALVRVDLETDIATVATDSTGAGLGLSTEASPTTVASGAPETDAMTGSGAAKTFVDADLLFGDSFGTQ